MKRFNFIFVFCGIGLFFHSAHPCKRPVSYREPLFEDRVSSAHKVFIGKVQSQKQLSETGGWQYQLDFLVEQNLKGRSPQKVSLIVESSSCDPFGRYASAGSSCVVFLNQEQKHSGGSICKQDGERYTNQEIQEFRKKVILASNAKPVQILPKTAVKKDPRPAVQDNPFLEKLKFSKVSDSWTLSIADFCIKQNSQYVPLAGTRCDQTKVFLEESYGTFSVISCDNKTADSKKSVVWESIACGTTKQRTELVNSQMVAPNSNAVHSESHPGLSKNGSESECKKQGGSWDDVKGRGHVYGCNFPTSDAGKACQDSKECESVCVDKKCYGWKEFRGCGVIVGDKVMCVD
jgi:hypothetical protein